MTAAQHLRLMSLSRTRSLPPGFRAALADELPTMTSSLADDAIAFMETAPVAR